MPPFPTAPAYGTSGILWCLRADWWNWCWMWCEISCGSIPKFYGPWLRRMEHIRCSRDAVMLIGESYGLRTWIQHGILWNAPRACCGSADDHLERKLGRIHLEQTVSWTVHLRLITTRRSLIPRGFTIPTINVSDDPRGIWTVIISTDGDRGAAIRYLYPFDIYRGSYVHPNPTFRGTAYCYLWTSWCRSGGYSITGRNARRPRGLVSWHPGLFENLTASSARMEARPAKTADRGQGSARPWKDPRIRLCWQWQMQPNQLDDASRISIGIRSPTMIMRRTTPDLRMPPAGVTMLDWLGLTNERYTLSPYIRPIAHGGACRRPSRNQKINGLGRVVGGIVHVTANAGEHLAACTGSRKALWNQTRGGSLHLEGMRIRVRFRWIRTIRPEEDSPFSSVRTLDHLSYWALPIPSRPAAGACITFLRSSLESRQQENSGRAMLPVPTGDHASVVPPFQTNLRMLRDSTVSELGTLGAENSATSVRTNAWPYGYPWRGFAGYQRIWIRRPEPATVVRFLMPRFGTQPQRMTAPTSFTGRNQLRDRWSQPGSAACGQRNRPDPLINGILPSLPTTGQPQQETDFGSQLVLRPRVDLLELPKRSGELRPLGSQETVWHHPAEVLRAYEEVYGESPIGFREVPSTDHGDAGRWKLWNTIPVTMKKTPTPCDNQNRKLLFQSSSWKFLFKIIMKPKLVFFDCCAELDSQYMVPDHVSYGWSLTAFLIIGILLLLTYRAWCYVINFCLVPLRNSCWLKTLPCLYRNFVVRFVCIIFCRKLSRGHYNNIKIFQKHTNSIIIHFIPSLIFFPNS